MLLHVKIMQGNYSNAMMGIASFCAIALAVLAVGPPSMLGLFMWLRCIILGSKPKEL